MTDLKKKVLISGWYGFGNLGDEAILHCIVRSLSSSFKDPEVAVLSYFPAVTSSYHTIKAFHHLPSGIGQWVKRSFNGKALQALKAFFWCDLLVIGGGGFLSDWQKEAPWYWLRQALLGRLLGKKVVLYGIGAGPFITKKGKFITRTLINNFVHGVTVRDQSSLECLLKAGVRKDLITLSADPVLSLKQEVSAEKKGPRKKIGFAIAPIFDREDFYPGKQHKYIHFKEQLKELVKKLSEDGFEVVFMSMQKSEDEEFSKEVAGSLAQVLEVPSDIHSAIQQLSEVDILVAMRFHASILGVILDVPVAGIIYHHKMGDFLKEMDLLSYASGIGDGSNWEESNVDASVLFDQIKQIESRYEEIQKQMRERLKSLKTREEENSKMLKKVLV